jgi:hypothetical protein
MDYLNIALFWRFEKGGLRNGTLPPGGYGSMGIPNRDFENRLWKG